MTIEKKLEFYERLYFHEIERRDKIDTSLGFHLGVITLLIGAIVTVMKIIHNPFSDFWIGLLSVCLLGVAFCTGLAVYFVIRVRWGHKYEYLPDVFDLEAYSRECDEYNQEIEEYNSQVSQNEYQPRIDLENEMVSRFSNASKRNTASNDNKSHYRHHATSMVAIALCLCFVGIAPYIVVQNKELPTYQHNPNIISAIGGNMEKSDTNEKYKTSSSQGKEKVQPKKQPPILPKKPKSPPNRILKEGEGKSKP